MAAKDTVVVLGADVEGLVAAAFLARAGRRVVLVDARAEPGGPAARLELCPRHAVPGLFHDPCLTRRALLEPLRLERQGLAWRAEPPLVVFREGAERVTLTRAPDGVQGADGDARAFAEWRGFVARLAPAVTRVLDEPPPDAVAPDPGELLRLARTGFALRRLGRRDLLELLRIAPMCARDWMHERFASPAVRAGIVAPCLHGTVLGPRAAGTSALVLLAECARGAEPVGGAAALVDALVSTCREAGVELRLGVRATRIRLDGRRVAGVELADGETIAAGAVASADDPGRTLLDLLPGGALAPKIEGEVAAWRTRGSDAVLLLALSSTPGELPARAIGAGSLVELERAADHLKYGSLPEAPWLDVRAWTDPDCAPPGGATLSVLMHGVPHALADGWTDDARENLADAALAALERLVPGAGASVVARELLTPADLEARFGLAGGHLARGELALDQLWLQRPALALARYTTPIEGLTLCGAASHPGGPFLGGAGALAARALLG